VIVSSGDKDLSQLVDEHITIIDTMNGKKRDVAGVTAEFGVPPALMIDYQALVGDTVDNVPGVTKVGPKTAAKWLEEYGSLDNLIAAAGIKGVAGQNLRDAIASGQLALSRQLVTMKTDCDLSAYIGGLPQLDAWRCASPIAPRCARSTRNTASRAWCMLALPRSRSQAAKPGKAAKATVPGRPVRCR
jgi:DNA polymerase-1